MTELKPELAQRILEACRGNAPEVSAAFSRALGVKIEVSVDKADTIPSEAAAKGPGGAGLAIVLGSGPAALVLLVPEASGILPTWYRTPDATARSKLATLAQELSILFLPEGITATSYEAAGVGDLRKALLRGKPASDVGRVALVLKSDQRQQDATLLWPITVPADVLTDPNQGSVAQTAPVRSLAEPAHEDAWARLPAYAKSLLRVRVPFRVVLAERLQSIESIVRVGAGSIIQFEKSCEEMLDVEVANQRIAQGEVVKVGEKFGIRITSILLPQERFRRLHAERGGE
jgi:flagellar motor switch protein FliN/FliY